jgi:hypothetical protein
VSWIILYLQREIVFLLTKPVIVFQTSICFCMLWVLMPLKFPFLCKTFSQQTTPFFSFICFPRNKKGHFIFFTLIKSLFHIYKYKQSHTYLSYTTKKINNTEPLFYNYVQKNYVFHYLIQMFVFNRVLCMYNFGGISIIEQKKLVCGAEQNIFMTRRRGYYVS